MGTECGEDGAVFLTFGVVVFAIKSALQDIAARTGAHDRVIKGSDIGRDVSCKSIACKEGNN